MKQKMRAEILFLERCDVQPSIAALESLGFEVETHDWVDPYSDETVWIIARIESELDQDAFFCWAANIINHRLHGADLVEAGLENPPSQAA